MSIQSSARSIEDHLGLIKTGARDEGSFATERYVIEMTVGFPEPYVGRRLVSYGSVNPQKELCYSGDGGILGKCLERFVGALSRPSGQTKRR